MAMEDAGGTGDLALMINTEMIILRTVREIILLLTYQHVIRNA